MHITSISIPLSFQGITFDSVSLNIHQPSFLVHSSLHAFSPFVQPKCHTFPPPQSRRPKPNTIFLLHSHYRITLCVTFHPRLTTSPPFITNIPFGFHFSYFGLFTLSFFLSKNAVKPVFRHKIVPVEINIGNIAKFECETEDAPNVSFKWSKDGHPIKESDKCRIISRFSRSSLELLSPTKDDSGEYTCRASNQHGSDECSASLSVTGQSDACFILLRWLSLELLLVLNETFFCKMSSCCCSLVFC